MIKDFIPENTLEEIKNHLTKNSRVGERRWPSVKDEEDAGTGDFCGQLSSNWERFSKKDDQNGRWRISYRKFGSRKNSLEPLTGADGIFQISVFNSFGKPIFRKGLLFQAKKEPIKNREELIGQINKMNNFTIDKGNSVFVFGENGYFAMTGQEFIVNPKSRKFSSENAIGKFLSEEFMECRVGIEDLFFDTHKDLLYIPRTEPLSGDLRHKMIIEIEKK